VRGHDVYIIKSFENKNIDDGIMELLLAVSCMKKSGAEKVTAIVPFFPYSTMTSAISEGINEGVDFHTCFAADIVKML
jgi:ribose-phosphate pyrophosphokinase